MARTILYCYPSISTFIQKDIDLLRKHYEVKEFNFSTKKKNKIPVKLVQQAVFLSKKLRQADIVICRFAGYHSLLPGYFSKLFNKPFLLIIGGTESHYFPATNHGTYINKFYGKATAISLQLATHIAPVHESLILSDYTYADHPSPQGYKAFVKGVDAPATVIYNGYEPDKFYPLNLSRPNNSYVTVAGTIEGAEFYRKGIDLIFEAAVLFPEAQFTVYGKTTSIPLPKPKNVDINPPVPYVELNKIYNQYRFYVQFSLAEGFPNALSEAMLAGCVPIGSAVFGIPTIIGDTGYILHKKGATEAADLLKKAMKEGKSGEQARQRIIDNFHIRKREERLLTLLRELIKSK